jgi:hypothetical protein
MNTALKFKAIVLLILSVIRLSSQTVLNIHLTDLHKKPLPFAVIKYKGSTITSNESGFFRIDNYTAGSKIEIHKLGFADTTITLAPNQLTQDTIHLAIALRLKIILIPEVSVNSSRIEEINPMKADFVIGYELKGDFLIELLSDDNIVLIDADNKVRSRSRPIPGAKDIVKDPYGDIYILTEKTAHKIYFNNSDLRVDPVSADLAKLMWDIQYCDEATGTTRYIRRYKDNNQTVAFFATSNLNKNAVKLLKEITHVKRREAVQDYANETNALNQYVESLGLSKVTATTMQELELVREAQNMIDKLEMIYALPSYSFLKLVNDSIYLFAHDIDSMFVYDQHWNPLKGERINYHHLKMWGKELIVNEERTRVYAKLIQDSKPMIAEIDLQTGTLKSSSFALESRFPTKIKIRNNSIYFMAKQRNGVGYTVYSQNFQLSR